MGSKPSTIDPRTFVRVKPWLAAQAARDPLKRRKDALQADTVDAELAQYLPHIEAHS